MDELAVRFRATAEFVVIYGRESHLEQWETFANLLPGAKPAPQLSLAEDWEACAARARLFQILRADDPDTSIIDSFLAERNL